jgi:hypothetical protein
MKENKTDNRKALNATPNEDVIINIDFIKKNIEILDDKLSKIRRRL